MKPNSEEQTDNTFYTGKHVRLHLVDPTLAPSQERDDQPVYRIGTVSPGLNFTIDTSSGPEPAFELNKAAVIRTMWIRHDKSTLWSER